jgi:hypothetical protein
MGQDSLLCAAGLQLTGKLISGTTSYLRLVFLRAPLKLHCKPLQGITGTLQVHTLNLYRV